MSINTEHPDASLSSFKQDAHYEHLISVVPPWLAQASTQKRDALKNVRPRLPDGLKDAPRRQHAELGKLNAEHWKAQNRVDQALARVQNASAFAEPLLQTEIRKRFALELDVRQTFVRFYIPAHIPWLRLKSGAARIWTVSLLDAALHNFESSETENDAFEPASTYISPPSPSGQFNALPHVLQTMPITAFTRLCRELDIGERYKTYLEENLGISNPVVAAILQPRIRDSQKAALTAALQMAYLQNQLGGDTHRLILGLLDGLPHLRLRRQAWGCHELTIMNASLTGIVLFAPDLERSREEVRVVAYIPDDPQHPIKEYPSTSAFAQELIQRLRRHDYQKFFSRFINHEDRGHFFGQLNNHLGAITWQPVQSGDPRPTWRENPIQRPNLQMASLPIRGDLWTHLYQRKLDKILNDARVIAVSTATADQKARWTLWDSFTEIASALLNIAAFVTLPFVPFLGELMLAYMAYQLLDKTFESIVDWAEGLTIEAFEHFMGVVESAVQLGTFAAGGLVVAGEFRAVLPRQIVEFIDRFNSVKRPNGETRYWKPDLTAYEHPAAPPKDSKPDALGLHSHHGKTLLALENKRYAVSEDPATGQHRIDHPTRPETYKPVLKHNGAGAWQTELDQPLSWDQATLLRRIGPDMERFSASERERMLTISGCHENALRKVHVNAEQVPPLLADTLKRFKIDQDIQTFIEQIGSDRPEDFLKADPLMQLELLHDNGYWPANKGVRLIDEKAQILWQSPAPDVPLLQIDAASLNDGDLLKTFLLTLSDSETRTLMGEEFGLPSPRLESRTGSLRRILAQLAQRKRQSLFEQRYRRLERGARSAAQTLIDAETGLPTGIAEAIAGTANDLELQALKRGTIPPRLTDLSVEAGLQVRVTRAYEGLELPSTEHNPDTDRLALHSLEKLPGWTGQLRLEIRHYSHDGSLIESLGSADARTRKVLVLSEEGSYQAFDHAGEELGGSTTFLTSLLQAMPDNERTALDVQIGDDGRLKQLIRQHTLSRDALRTLLAQHPNLKPAYDPKVMRLLGGGDGYRHMPTNTPTLQARAQTLFPHLSADELQAFVVRLQQRPGGPRAELNRLMVQHTQLVNILSPWTNEIPLVIPDTQTRLTPEQFLAQKQARQQFAINLMDCWRQQWVLPESTLETVDFNFFQPIIGELPSLSADFSAVSIVSLDGNGTTRGVHEFLRSFSGLRRLTLRNVTLGYFPDAIARSPQLKELILSNCAITLSSESLAKLSALNQLTTLDLYKNPLGLVPIVEHMPNLNYVDVSQTGITDFPHGLLTRPSLRTALLNDNAIHELPTALFNLPTSTREGFDLGGNPISAADRERIKQHFIQTRQEFGVYAEDADINRIQALYPLTDKEEASELFYLLPGTTADARAELTRRENQLSTLSNDLDAWTANIPALHPVSGEPFTAQQLLIEHSTRDEFKHLLESCWRRESVFDEFNQSTEPSHELTLALIITGDLPVLHADFSHVSMLYLHSNAGLTSGAARFLENFPNLKTLTIQEYRLGNIPEAIFRMGDLTAMSLPDCHITLTAQTVLELAQMERLEYLDLTNNPLGLAPDVNQMAVLTTLQLENCGISELPAGLLKLKNLESVDLSANAITRIPRDILELPMEIAEVIDLRGNPLSEESVQILIGFFRKTSVDFGVEAVIERAEMEVSTSEGSDADE